MKKHFTTTSPNRSSSPWIFQVSVCIPAYNEEATIGPLLEHLLAEEDTSLDEILVCANGCTDNTEEIVQAHAGRDSRVRLLHSSPGKPNAWNTLITSAQNDIVVFLDADISLAAGSIPSLVDKIVGHPDLVCVSGIHLPQKGKDVFFPGSGKGFFFPGSGKGFFFPGSGKGFFLAGAVARLASRPSVFDYVYGGLYALNRKQLFTRLQALGSTPPHMPEDLIADDYWIELVSGKDGFLVDRNAIAFFNPGTVEDVLRARVRFQVSRLQILKDRDQPRAFHKRARKAPARKLFAKLRAPAPVSEKNIGFTGTLTRLALLSFYRKQVSCLKSQMIADVDAKRGASVLSHSGRISIKKQKTDGEKTTQ